MLSDKVKLGSQTVGVSAQASFYACTLHRDVKLCKTSILLYIFSETAKETEKIYSVLMKPTE